MRRRAIAALDQLPRFLLLGERDDASFQRHDGGYTVDYVWPELTEGPVCRIQAHEGRFQVQEFWDTETVYHSTGAGQHLADGLDYHFRATLALRNARRIFPDGHVSPSEIDPREPYFFSWCRDRLGIRWKLPTPGPRLHVDQPAGIMRALVVPCAPGQGAVLADLADTFVRRPDVWAVDDRPAATRCGRFSRRTAAVTWRPSANQSEELCTESVECRIFVGGWRSVIELAAFLVDAGWDLTGHRFHAFICFPHNLVTGYRNQQGRQDDADSLNVFYPPLLPPQAVGEVFPEGGRPHVYTMANPQAPVVTLYRPRTGTPCKVPALCVLVDDDLATPSAIFRLVHDATDKWLRLGYQESTGAGTFCVFPNIPPLTHCHDPEGFYHLLPDAVRRLEQELGTSWIVDDFWLGGNHEGEAITVAAPAGPRKEGW